jgi:hypothetical protein
MFIGVALALVVGLVWVPAVGAVSADIIVHKTVEPGGPEETFRFEAWRDMNDSGDLDAGDVLEGWVDITGEGTGVITVGIFGQYIIHEVLMPGSAYEPQPDQVLFVACDEHVYFENVLLKGELIIVKADRSGEPLAGACFTITPDPRTGEGFLELCDNQPPDGCPEDGVLCLSDCIIDLVCTIEETTVPPGYEGAPPQTVTISALVEVTFVNTEEERGQLKIIKRHICGFLLGGATFLIEPNPQTGAGSLTVVDNGLNDEDPTTGILLVTNCIKGLTCTVTETVPPPGYVGGSPQTVTITGSLTFINKPWWWRWINWV